MRRSGSRTQYGLYYRKQRSETDGNWAAWKAYRSTYEEVFNGISRFLMQYTDNELEPFVNSLPLDELEIRATKTMTELSLESIAELCEATATYYGFKQEFNTYLLVGLGNIGGAALVHPPSLFFGLEVFNPHNIEQLIPHEFNHLVRFTSLPDIDVQKTTVRDMIVAEGLATLAPTVMKGEPINNETLRRALMVSEDTFQELLVHAELLEDMVISDLDKPLTGDVLQKYFSVNNSHNIPPVSGYFIGSKRIAKVLDAGYSLPKLTTETTEIIWELHDKLQD